MLEEFIKNRPLIHTRNISLSAVPHTESQIIVHGELKDERHVHIIDILGRDKPPGIVHHMTATLLIAPDPLRIEQAEAKMITVPVDQCPETLDRIELIQGLEVKPGFSQKVRNLVGGANGCAHLCTLVKAMGTEIIHGGLTWKRHQDRDKDRIPQIPKESPVYLVDSCRLWKKGGPRYNTLMQAIDHQAEDHT